MKKGDSFSFDEIANVEKIDIGTPSFIKASDGINLAYYATRVVTPVASLAFLHGGGAYSGAGYQNLAKGLGAKYNISVYLLDIRGHGNSDGPRGDSPTVDQVWKDVQLFCDFVQADAPQLPLYLGGHSSGGGLVLNYLSWKKNPDIAGYVFVSPEFGYKSGTARQGNATPFARVDIEVFMKYGASLGAQYGNTQAVFFNYPEEVLEAQPLLIKSITCNMAMALTPDNPQEQFKKIDKPFALFVGENDELFDVDKVLQYGELADKEIRQKSIVRAIKGANHLSILLAADEFIGNAIMAMRGSSS
ncbi:MAG: alpha/beta fold hydrolase [Dehalococcoidia bacterium]|jgi:alpha-beta hydrolase superfamily lysophospholipase